MRVVKVMLLNDADQDIDRCEAPGFETRGANAEEVMKKMRVEADRIRENIPFLPIYEFLIGVK